MAFRIIYECDSLEEFERLQQALFRDGGNTRRRGSDSARIFRRADLEAIKKLSECADGMRTDDFAAVLHISNASLPPTLNGWGRRAAGLGLTLDDLIERERLHEQGRPITVYKLTAKGREVLERQLQEGKDALS